MIKGNAFVQLSSRANVKDVLSQVKDLAFGMGKLKISEMKRREEERLSDGGRSSSGVFNSTSRGTSRRFGRGSVIRSGFNGNRSDNNQRDSGFGRNATICGSIRMAEDRKFKHFTLKIHDVDENERHELKV